MTGKSYGTVSRERQKAMSGLEFVKGLASGALPLNTFAQTLAYDVVEAENGRVAISLDPTAAHLNPWGTVHGGLTATLLDSCMGLAIQSNFSERGFGSTTLEFKISLVRAITLETRQIRLRAKCSTAAAIGTAEGRVTDTSGRLLAHGTNHVPHFPKLSAAAAFLVLRRRRCVMA